MKQAVLLGAAAAAALSLAACQKKPAAPETPAPEAAAAPAAAPAPAVQTANATPDAEVAAGPIDPVPAAIAAAPPTPAAKKAGATEATQDVINGVALTDLYQIQAGKIAEAKAQAPAVKDFAKAMVTDHTATTNQMKHLFVTLSVKIPTELGPRGQRMIEALNAAPPAEFDKTYLSQQQAAQAAELTLLRVYADGGESTDIKPAAAKRIPKVQASLDKVHELQAAEAQAPRPPG
jgi:putative membrane protein